MRRNLLLSLLCLPGLLHAQTMVKGFVTEQNSGNKPIPGVQIKALGSTPELTDNAGLFQMVFTSKKPGDRIVVSEISKKGYEIVNKDVVNNWVITNNPNDKIKIVMCPEGLIAQNTLKYYDISLAGLTEGYQYRIKELQEERDKAKIDAKTFGEQAKVLADKFENQQMQLEELADKFARENFDDCSAIHRQAFEAFKAGNIGEAIRIMETVNSEAEISKAKIQHEKAMSALNQSDSIIQQNIRKLIFQAGLYAASLRFDEAERAFESAVYADSSDFNHILEFATYLQEQTLYMKGMKWCKTALELAKTDIERASVLNQMSIIQASTNLFDDAENSLTEVIRIQNELFESNPEEYGTALIYSLINLSHTHTTKGQWDKGVAELNRALAVHHEIIKQNHDAESTGYANILSALGRLYGELNQNDKAEKYTSEAIDLFREFARESTQLGNYNLAATLLNAGNLQLKMNLLDKAESNLSEAVKICRELVRINPQANKRALAISLNNLAIFYMNTNRTEKSDDYFNESVGVFRELVKQNPLAYKPDLAGILGNQANGSNSLSDKSREQKFNEAIQIYRELASSEPLVYNHHLARVLSDYGDFQMAVNQYDKAKSVYDESLQLFTGLAKAQPLLFQKNVAQLLFCIGGYYYKKNQFGKGDEYFEECLTLSRELVKTDSVAYRPVLADALDNIANVQMNMNEMDKSIIHFIEALSIYNELAETNPTYYKPTIALDLNQLSWAQYKTDLPKAIEYADNAIKIYLQTFDSVSTDISGFARCCSRMSKYKLLNKQYDEAEKYSRMAISYDKNSLALLKNLAHSFLFQGKFEEAKEIYLKLKTEKFNEAITYKELILKDLDEFESKGITHPDVAKIRELLKQ